VVDEPVRKIAHVLKITEEMLEDFEQTRSWVNGRLAFGVQLREDQQLYNGNGTAPNISGILDRANVQTQAKGAETYFPNYIAVMKAKKKISDYFYNADGLVVAPGDWLDMQLEADANGQFGGGGPFRGPYGNGTGPQEEGPYAGLRVVVTPAATEGTALVGAFAQASQIFRRSGITVETTNSNEDDFIKNLVAVRAEERLALAVYSGYAFATVTGLGA
jgi:HK97 family phage major capsid protein